MSNICHFDYQVVIVTCSICNSPCAQISLGHFLCRLHSGAYMPWHLMAHIWNSFRSICLELLETPSLQRVGQHWSLDPGLLEGKPSTLTSSSQEKSWTMIYVPGLSFQIQAETIILPEILPLPDFLSSPALCPLLLIGSP